MTLSQFCEQYQKTILGLIVVIGLAVRLAGLDVHSIWYDEAYTANLSKAGVSAILNGEAADLGNPPLYWLVAKFSAAFVPDSLSEKALRWFSVVCGVMTILVLFDIGRKAATASVGLMAAFLWAISPLSLELSTSARGYALLHLLTAANTLLFLHWIERTSNNIQADGNRSSWPVRIGYVLTMSAMCLTHYFAVLVAISHAMTLLVSRASWRQIGDWFGQTVVAASMSIFWLPVFLHQLEAKGNVSRFMEAWFIQFFATPLVFTFGRTLVWRDDSMFLLAAISMCAIVLFWLPALLGIWNLSRRLNASIVIPFWLCITLATPILFSFLLGSPIYHLRAASVALPAFILLAATGLASLPQRVNGPILATGCVITTVSIFQFFTEPLKDDWRSATPEILAHLQSDDVIIFDTEIEVLPFLYYVERSEQPTPGQMFGLVGPSEQKDKLSGIPWSNGKQIQDDPIDCTQQVLSRNEFWIVTCKPYTDTVDYLKRFKNSGFHVDQHVRSHRINAFRMIRPSLSSAIRKDTLCQDESGETPYDPTT